MEPPSLQPKPGEITPLTSFASSVSFGDDKGSQSNSLPHPPLSQNYRLYHRRWLILLTYSLINFSNGWVWTTWSPLTALLTEYWDVTVNAVDALSGVYMFVFVPTNIFSMWLVVNYLGLRRGLQFGAFLNMLGTLVKYKVDWFLGGLTDYKMKYMGVFLCALSQAFILPMVALLAGNWFGERERATATSLGSMAFQLGSLFGLASTVVVDFRDETSGKLDQNKFDQYMQLQWVVASLALLLALVTVNKDRPDHPPSEAAAALAQNVLSTNYTESIRMIMASPSSQTFFFVFGMVVGSFYAIPAFLSQFMPSWSPRSQGALGGIFQVAAVSGCMATGRLVSFWNLQYKKVSLFLLKGCLVSVALYLLSVWLQSYLAMIACAGMGFFFASFMTVGIEFGTSLTFPADEAAVYGILDSTGELWGFVLVTLGGTLSREHLDVTYCCILVALVSLSFGLLWQLKPLIRRPSIMSSANSLVMESSLTF